ncbi:hypothetical protein CK203_094993 [Vitis vinifera]|uniref:Reverse transcriptase domain-containing protein n=1 Tax=Vitis vinifera TaxID=29760 RepID=A0A438ED16_VITVI|nr:hypothetical protein CK203_094993 [Vitis vinifera]
MEVLSQLLSCARNGGFISGFRVGGRGREGLIVSHLLFADDTLIFCDTKADQLQYLSWTFMWFEAISGLKVNLSKTEAFLVGEGIPMETLASVLGCKIGSLPTTYLGLPLGSPYKSTRAIRNGWESFRSHSRFIVGDGIRVKFWKDLWCENQSLEEAFPTLFNLSVNKDSWVAEAWRKTELGKLGASL